MGGLRAKLLLNPQASFPLAREFHSTGISLTSAFSFTSGLYFRGKISYATHFAHFDRGDMIRIITSNAGLLVPDTRVGPTEIIAFGATDIAADDPAYCIPLRRHALSLAKRIGPHGTAVLLGSIATPKYREVLLDAFGDRLLFPSDFVGRGDMSRGALLLHAVRADRELPYQKVAEAVLTGRRASRVREISP